MAGRRFSKIRSTVCFLLLSLPSPLFLFLLLFNCPFAAVAADDLNFSGSPLPFRCFESVSTRFERFWSLDDYHHFVDKVALPDEQFRIDERLGFRHIFFVVKASRARAEQARLMESVWLHATAGHVLVVDDFIPGLPESVQVVVNGGDNMDEASRKQDALAVSRLSIWLRQSLRDDEPWNAIPPETKWIVILGDDVFMNLARLYYLLAQHDAERHPIAFADVLSNVAVYDFDLPCLDQGAVVLNVAALRLLSETLSCKECPYVGSDAISIGYCLAANGVPLVHHPNFHCGSVHSQEEEAEEEEEEQQQQQQEKKQQQQQQQQQSSKPSKKKKLVAALGARPFQHLWIASGGLSKSILDDERARQWIMPIRYHPFESSFPNFDFELPESGVWTAAQLMEKLRFLELKSRAHGSASGISKPGILVGHGQTLDAQSLDAYFDTRWQRQEPLPGGIEVVTSWAALTKTWVVERLAVLRSEKWVFVGAADTWFHDSLVSEHLHRLQKHIDLEAPLFGFFGAQGTLDLRAGVLVSPVAAKRLVAARAEDLPTWTQSALKGLKVDPVHHHQMVPRASWLPTDLRGMVSTSSVSVAWSLGQIRDHTMMDDLDEKAADRRYFQQLLLENYEDLQKNDPQSLQACRISDDSGQSMSRLARSWFKYLHNDDEHLKVVRGFKGGHREFRVQNSIYRSEVTPTLPTYGINQDTVVVARECGLEG